MNAELQIVRDPIAEKLDELADLAELWKAGRKKGRDSESIRTAMLHAAGVITFLSTQRP
jgi:hypothetical protein